MESELAKTQREIQKTEKEYANLEQQLQKVQQVADFEKLASGAISPGNAAEIERLTSELDRAGSKLGELDDNATRLQSSIENVKLDPTQTEEAQRLADKLANAEEKAERLANEANSLAGQIENAASASDGLPRGPTRASTQMERLTKTTRKANREIQRTNKSTGGLLGTVDKLGKRLLKLGAAVFVFNQIRRALRSLQDHLGSVMRTNQELINSLASVKGNLLTAFQPIYEAILPALNALAAALARVTGFIAAFVNMLFGKSAKASQDAAKGLYNQAKALGATGKAAKDAAGQLAAFDEINVLAAQNAEDAAGAGGDVIAPDFDYDLSGWDEWLDKAKDVIGRILDVFKAAWANVGDYVLAGWEHAVSNILELARKIGATFLEVWTDGHGQELLEAWLTLLGTILFIIGDIAAAFSAAWDVAGYDLVASLFEMLTNIGWLLNSIGLAFREAWNDGTGISIATHILQIFANINYTISELAKRLEEAWEANGNGVAIWSAILGIVDDTLRSINRITAATLKWAKEIDLEPLISGFRDLLESIRPVVDILTDGLAWAYENVLLPFATWLIELAVPAALELLEKAFDALRAVFEAIQPGATWIWENFLVPLGQWTGDKILNALQFLGEKFEQVTKWIEENGDTINEVIEGIGNVFKTVWEDWLQPTLDIAWEAIKNIIDSILEILAGLITFLAGVFTGDWEKAWEGVKDIFSGLWNGIASVLESIINIMITQLNSFIKQINKIQFDVPDWVPIIGGKTWGFNLPELSTISIPKLATGAVIPPNSEFLAVLGDQKHGTNIEAPLQTIVDAVTTALENMEFNGGGVDVNINFSGELAALARLLNVEIQKVENEQIGLTRGGVLLT